MEFNWRNTGDYVSVADVIGIYSATFLSSTHLERVVSLGAASALSCSPTERSTEEETPIARRAVSVCAQPTFIADLYSLPSFVL